MCRSRPMSRRVVNWPMSQLQNGNLEVKAERHVFRNREQATLLLIMSVGFVGGMLTWLSLARNAPLSARVFGGVSALGYGAFVFKAARSAVFADSAGIRVVNPIRTRFFPWDEVLHFTVDHFGLNPKIGLVVLRDGSRFPMFALAGPNPLGRPRNRTAETLVEGLNDLLTEYRSARS
jgi:hypothetical protein